MEVRFVVGRSSGHNAIEIFRKTLRFFESLPATCRAAVPIREAGRTTIIGPDERPGLERGFVNTAITEVDDFLGMAKAGAAALVPAIGGGGGLALL